MFYLFNQCWLLREDRFEKNKCGFKSITCPDANGITLIPQKSKESTSTGNKSQVAHWKKMELKFNIINIKKPWQQVQPSLRLTIKILKLWIVLSLTITNSEEIYLRLALSRAAWRPGKIYSDIVIKDQNYASHGIPCDIP